MGGAVRIFVDMPVFARVADRRAQCHKVLEEASELCEAGKRYDKVPHDAGRTATLDELADLAQAAVNLSAAFGVTDPEMREALARCRDRNSARGRY